MKDSTKEFAKDYWELGAMALTAYAASKNPAYRALLSLGGLGLAGYSFHILKKYREKKELPFESFRMLRAVPFYMGASMLLDKSMEQLHDVSDVQRMSIPLLMLTASAAIDFMRLDGKERLERARVDSNGGLEDRLK